MDRGTIFERAVIRDPGAPAIVDGDLRRTYGEWYGDIRHVAGGLGARGLGPGDHIVPVLSNRFEMAFPPFVEGSAGLVPGPFGSLAVLIRSPSR